MRILIAEPYFGGSHRAWAEGYRDSSSHDVELITLPARWWRWRMRGGAVSLVEQAENLAAAGYRPDVVVASSMIDLALFRAQLDGVWGRIPTALYLHETQLTYPDSPQLEPDLSYAFMNWTSALVADRVIFNSEFHRSVFFEELPRLLRGFPDHRHEHLIPNVWHKTEVLPVGVDLSWRTAHLRSNDRAPLVLWNHRWEHDKAPQLFLEAVSRLEAGGAEFRLALCGESFRQVPAEFEAARVALGERIVHYGFAAREEYRRIVAGSDVVVSTALQEFFGVSMVEAAACGAVPIAPNRLSYPELFPPECLYDDGELDGLLTRAVTDCDWRSGMSSTTAPAMDVFGWDVVAPRYDALTASML
jgi:glycosyltransferase involved in cell wall biosynthesis